MKELIRTASVSQAESLRIALETQGITTVNNQNLSGVPPAAITVAVDDADYERALAILRELQVTPASTGFRRMPTTRAVILFALIGSILITALCFL